MANEEHLARLEEGVEAWNQWRFAHRDIRPDLSKVHASNGFNLFRANLGGANLREADLALADLTGVDLTGADLTGADLSRVNILRTDLTGATIGWTIFATVDLSTALGLETIHHQGP